MLLCRGRRKIPQKNSNSGEAATSIKCQDPTWLGAFILPMAKARPKRNKPVVKTRGRCRRAETGGLPMTMRWDCTFVPTGSRMPKPRWDPMRAVRACCFTAKRPAEKPALVLQSGDEMSALGWGELLQTFV